MALSEQDHQNNQEREKGKAYLQLNSHCLVQDPASHRHLALYYRLVSLGHKVALVPYRSLEYVRTSVLVLLKVSLDVDSAQIFYVWMLGLDGV